MLHEITYEFDLGTFTSSEPLIRLLDLDSDPVKHPDAHFFPSLSYDRVLREGLAVMDATAVILCKEQKLPLRVMNINIEGALRRVVQGEDVGTLVTSGEES